LAPWQRVLLKQPGVPAFDWWQPAQEEACPGFVPVWVCCQPAGCELLAPWQRVLLKQPGVPAFDWWQPAQLEASEGLAPEWADRQPGGWPDFGP